MKSAWINELFRQWQAARGSRLEPSKTVFSRDWERLLECAGVHTAEDRKLSEDEAQTFAAAGRVKLVLHRHRHIKRVQVPLDQEEWLRAKFGSTSANEVLARAKQIIAKQRSLSHTCFPAEWSAWCDRLNTAFEAGKVLRPLSWRKPASIEPVMNLVRALTSRDWPPFTLVRDVDVALGLATKTIEGHQRVLETAMSELFQREMTLDGLGIVSSNSEARFHGPLVLHFEDGTEQAFTGSLHHASVVTAADLARAIAIQTMARVIVTVENRKTTFRHIVAANQESNALVISTSFPTRAVSLLLEKLSVELPHHHFGDTDAAGYFILHKLRQLSRRVVIPLSMDWQDKAESPVLREYDRRTIETLLSMPDMRDCYEDLLRMQQAGRRGSFEQEERDISEVLGKLGASSAAFLPVELPLG